MLFVCEILWYSISSLRSCRSSGVIDTAMFFAIGSSGIPDFAWNFAVQRDHDHFLWPTNMSGQQVKIQTNFWTCAGHVIPISINVSWRDKRIDIRFVSPSQFERKLLTKSVCWPQMTADDLLRCQWQNTEKNVHKEQPYLLRSSPNQMDPISIMEMTNISILPHWTNGEVTKSTWHKVTDIQNPRCNCCRLK